MSGDLTFAELRFANMVNPGARTPEIKLDELEIFNKMDTPTLTKTLAEMVIQADHMAAIRGIDLVAAIRERFTPEQKDKNQ